MKRIFTLTNLPILLTIIIIVIMRLHLSVTRYFDSDELSHLHWAYLVSQGQVPYRDFFFYITPIFQWFLSPIFLLPHDAGLAIIARLWQFAVYISTTFVLYRLAKVITNQVLVSLIAVLIFLSFPMTFDKTVDVRPDMLMTLLFVAPILVLFETRRITRRLAILVGFSLSLSVLLLPKIIFAIPALLLLLAIYNKKLNKKTALFLILGILIPGLILGLYYVSQSIVREAFHSIVKESVAVNAGKIPFSLWKSLSPWPLVYIDRGGTSWPWMVNTIIWILALPGILFLLIKNKIPAIFLLVYFVSGAIFLFVFPSPYLQYFIPFSPFVSLLAAYSVYTLFSLLSPILKRNSKLETFSTIIFYSGISFVLASSFYQQYTLRVAPGSNNEEQIGVLHDVARISKADEHFYDMVGSYIYRPDAFILCCHPYNEFLHLLSRPVPTLAESILKTKTKFVILDRTGISLWKTPEPDLTFLKSNYYPSAYKKIYTLGYHYSCAAGRCTQIDVEDRLLAQPAINSVPIIIEEFYKVTTVPAGQTISLGSTSIRDGDPFRLTPASYSLSTPTSVREVTIQLAR